MNYYDFYKSMFELVDHWSDSLDVLEYVDLAHDLLRIARKGKASGVYNGDPGTDSEPEPEPEPPVGPKESTPVEAPPLLPKPAIVHFVSDVPVVPTPKSVISPGVSPKRVAAKRMDWGERPSLEKPTPSPQPEAQPEPVTPTPVQPSTPQPLVMKAPTPEPTVSAEPAPIRAPTPDIAPIENMCVARDTAR